jgi:hypothetical protein
VYIATKKRKRKGEILVLYVACLSVGIVRIYWKIMSIVRNVRNTYVKIVSQSANGVSSVRDTFARIVRVKFVLFVKV